MNARLLAFGGIQPIVDAPVWVMLLLKLTVILLAAWLVHLAIARTNPRWRVVLWRVTAVGLIAMPSVAWLFPSLDIPVQQARVIEKAAVVATVPEASTRSTNNRADARAASSVLAKSNGRRARTTSSVVAGTASPQPEAFVTESHRTSWAWLLPMVWLGGVAVFWVRLCVGQYGISAIARRAEQASRAICCECDRVAGAIGCLGRVEVLQTTEVASPFLCGLRRPRLLLPVRMCEPSYRKDLPGILAHELAHVRSHDVAWNAALQSIAVVFWFHPLIWSVRRAHLAACELVSDAVSASYVGDVSDYCRTLARVAVDVCGSLPSAGIAMARTSAISRRLGALKKRVFHLPLRRCSVVGFGISALLAITVIGVLQFALAAPPTGEPVVGVANDKAKAGAAKKAVPKSSARPAFRPMEVQVFATDGKPLAGADVTAQARMDNSHGGPFACKTDVDGRAIVDAPREGASNYEVIVRKSGHVTARADWDDYDGNDVRLPEALTFTLEPGVTLGGRVVDEQGRPIVGVKVDAWGDITVEKRTSQTNESRGAFFGSNVTTDAEGKWHVDRVPKDLAGYHLYFSLRHPEFGCKWFKEKELPLDRLLAQTALLTLRKGVGVEGTVTTPDGKPAAGVTVGLYFKDSGSDCPRMKTDKNGRYRIVASQPGKYTVAAAVAGFVPDWKEITVGKDRQTVDLRLSKGERIRLRVVDQEGKPIPGIRVGTSFDFNKNNCRALMLDYESTGHSNPAYFAPTDAEGRWSRFWIPKDQISFDIEKRGYVRACVSVAPDEHEHVVRLLKPNIVRVVVLDPRGRPLPRANVHASVWTEEKDFNANHDYRTDAEGAAYVALPKTYYIVRFWAGKKPFVTMFSHWEQNELARDRKLPQEYTIRLESSVTVGGRIADEHGKPVAGANVQVTLRGGAMPAHGDGRTLYNIWLATTAGDANVGEKPAATTDADGRWSIDNVPDNEEAELDLLVSHPDFISDESWARIQNDGITTRMLRQKTAVFTMKRGVIVRGRVTDPDGKPIKDAIVVHGDDPYETRMTSKFVTDAAGRFVLPALRPGEQSLTVIAAGFAPQLRRIELRQGLPPQDFHMAPGKTIELRFVDAAGKPLSDVYVGILEWRGSKSIQSMHNPNHTKLPDSKIPSKSGVDGIWRWTATPDDAVRLEIYRKGFAHRELKTAGGDPPLTVTLKSDRSRKEPALMPGPASRPPRGSPR